MRGIRNTVFYPTFIVLIVIFIWNLTDSIRLNAYLSKINEFVGTNLGWFYLLVAAFSVIVCICLFFSSYGKTIIGGDGAKPMFTTWNWFCITICTTIAAGLIFWGAAEPLSHFMDPPQFLNIMPGSHEAAIFSISTMYLHWTITPYAIYCVPALMFAIVLYNYKKEFSFSSCFAPIYSGTEKPIFSAVIDSICVFTTVMGIVASLGQGILSIAGGLEKVVGIRNNQVTWTVVGIFIVAVFTISSCSGILKGIKWLSKINVYIFMVLLTGIFIVGPTSYILKLGLESAGVYIDNFFTRSFMLGSAADGSWSYFWTISTFANWMAWAPVIALFLGKISRGHSVRKFILINLVSPAICSGIWVAVFGGASTYIQSGQSVLYAQMQNDGIESVVYTLLTCLRYGKYILPVIVCVTFLSFVTASDSTTNALADLCWREKDGKKSTLTVIKIIWGIVIGAMAIIMIQGNGIDGIKMVSAFGGFPAAFLVLFSGISLLKVCNNNKKQKMEETKNEKTTNCNGF